MPNIKSSKKRMIMGREANQANRHKRSTLRTAVKRVRLAETPDEARASYQRAVSLLDRAATRRLLHPNKAARIKSQLARHINALEG